MPATRSRSLPAAQVEQYLFYRLSSIDLDEALHSVLMLRRYRRPDVRYCILRDVVVSYARPFSGNRGWRNQQHRLPRRLIPQADRALHDELVNLRNQLFAHTDFHFRRPSLAAWELEYRHVFPMGFSGLDYQALIRRHRDIERLIRGVSVSLTEAILRAERRLSDAAAPSN